MNPQILALLAIVGAGFFVGNEVRHDFTALRHHGCCRVETAHRVRCERHGEVFLSDKQWSKYVRSKDYGTPYAHPSCPICGRPAQEDD